MHPDEYANWERVKVALESAVALTIIIIVEHVQYYQVNPTRWQGIWEMMMTVQVVRVS